MNTVDQARFVCENVLGSALSQNSMNEKKKHVQKQNKMDIIKYENRITYKLLFFKKHFNSDSRR